MIGRPDVPTRPLTRSWLPFGRYGWIRRSLRPCPPLAEAELGAVAEAMTAAKSKEHPDLPAVYTYFGQMIAHDLSFNPSSAGQLENDPQELYSLRTPALDLDSLYGGGPALQPYLYEPRFPERFRVGEGEDASTVDLPRIDRTTAVTADPRNDENLILSQLNVAFLELHNRFADDLREKEDLEWGECFRRARTLTQWHFQWVVLNDYLPRILHPDVGARLSEPVAGVGRWASAPLRYFLPEYSAYVPVEFAAAAFRFGHSLVREGYHLNEALKDSRNGVEIPLIDSEENDLRGGKQLPAAWRLDWGLFVAVDEGDIPQPAGLIDSHLSPSLGRLPLPGGGLLNLATRDLELGQYLELPSGQALAFAMGIDDVLSPEEIALPVATDRETPLWYYVLREAELRHAGRHLGHLGSEVVGEVIVGLVRRDRFSYLAVDPGWSPGPGWDGDYTLADLLRFAYS